LINRAFRAARQGGEQNINGTPWEVIHIKQIVHKQKGEIIMVKLNQIMKFMACLALITLFMGCAATRTHESTGGYVDDSTITAKVKTAILTDSELKVMQINVETFKGVVQLSGFVDSQKMSTKAADVARGVNGVVSVKNNLIVK
jgi:hypothetical protein